MNIQAFTGVTDYASLGDIISVAEQRFFIADGDGGYELWMLTSGSTSPALQPRAFLPFAQR